MILLRSLRPAALLLLVTAVMLTASCGDDKSTDTGGEALPRESVNGLVEQYTESLEAADLETYTDCLDDAYRFIFTDQDAEDMGLPPGEPWWLLATDLVSTEGMFDHDDLHSIQVDLTVVDQDTTDAGGDPVVSIQTDPAILVVLIPPGEEPYYLEVNSSWLYFEITRDPEDDRLWKISSIEEEPKLPLARGPKAAVAGAVDPLTFGDIKAIFYQP
jgi:hypothetical protein